MTTTDALPTTQADLTLDLEEEVRLAVVMYGGVSLAIYMYGVAEELWRLVRATSPDGVYDIRNPPATVRTYGDESTEPIYRDLARGTGEGAIRSRFVVDIVSGTSAGGINGVCLATALANDTRSEEHTSELQSHSDLVCRLLLEKKKNNILHLYQIKKQNNIHCSR